jgi:hypothetical protein
MALLADAAVLLRTHALVHAPAQPPLLHELAAHQSLLDFGLDFTSGPQIDWDQKSTGHSFFPLK